MNENQDDVVRETGLAKSKDNIYTYGDYLTWSDDNRYELIDGVVYNMTPAPYRQHQGILGELHRQIANYLFDKDCDVYGAPFDVRLPEGEEADEEILTVVQPDLAVICDHNKLDKRGCRGAPELVIEIVSPHSGGRDRKVKRELYERFGVEEYWIVDYNEKTVEVYKLDETGEYGKSKIYIDEDELPVGILEDLKIDLGLVFKE